MDIRKLTIPSLFLLLSSMTAIAADAEGSKYKTRTVREETGEIVITRIGDIACWENVKAKFGTVSRQPVCGLFVGYSKFFNDNTYEILKEGWVSNDERKINSVPFAEERMEVLECVGSKHSEHYRPGDSVAITSTFSEVPSISPDSAMVSKQASALDADTQHTKCAMLKTQFEFYLNQQTRLSGDIFKR